MAAAPEGAEPAPAAALDAGVADPAGPEPSAVPKTPVLRLRGLPFAATEDDVRGFFADFAVSEVLLVKRNGRATGEGYVSLESPEAAGVAIRTLHKQNLQHRYIELFEASPEEAAAARQASVDRMKGFVVRMRGLPYNATATDVLAFFEGIPIVRGQEGIIFAYAPDGRPTGEAYVELQDELSQQEAMKKHKETMGSRYIELFISSKADLIQAIQQNRTVLGFASRKAWLQAQGLHRLPPGPQQMFPPAPMPHLRAQYPQPRHLHQGRPLAMDEMVDAFRGVSLAAQPNQFTVLGPGGQVLPPGTYQLEVPGAGAAGGFYPPGGRGGIASGRRGAYPGGGRAGTRGGLMPGRGVPGLQQVVALGGAGGAVAAGQQGAQYIIQPPQVSHGQQAQQAQQYIFQQSPQSNPYDQQSWSGSQLILQPTAGAQGATYITQQGGGLAGMPPGTYTLTTIQLPSSDGGATFQVQPLEQSQLGGLQAMDLSQAVQAGGHTLQLEIPLTSAHARVPFSNGM